MQVKINSPDKTKRWKSIFFFPLPLDRERERENLTRLTISVSRSVTSTMGNGKKPFTGERLTEKQTLRIWTNYSWLYVRVRFEVIPN